MAYKLDRTVIEHGCAGVTYTIRSMTEDIDSLYESLGNAEERAMKRGDMVLENKTCLLILLDPNTNQITIYMILEVF